LGPAYNVITAQVHDGHTYFLASGPWEENEGLAQALGGHLATIGSQEEQDWAWNTFSPMIDSQIIHIGLSDREQEGQFVWASGEPVGYTNWSIGEPNNFNRTEDFVAMWGGFGGKWNDFAPNFGAYALIEVDSRTTQTRRCRSTRNAQCLGNLGRRHPLHLEQHEDGSELDRHGFEDSIEKLARSIALREILGRGRGVCERIQVLGAFTVAAPFRSRVDLVRDAHRRTANERALATDFDAIDALDGREEYALGRVVRVARRKSQAP